MNKNKGRWKPPAEGALVYEPGKPAQLYVVHVGPERISMGYRREGTAAVGATYDDFRLFFKLGEVPK